MHGRESQLLLLFVPVYSASMNARARPTVVRTRRAWRGGEVIYRTMDKLVVWARARATRLGLVGFGLGHASASLGFGSRRLRGRPIRPGLCDGSDNVLP